MKNKIILFFLFFFSLPILGQGGFLFEKEVNKVVIPFKFINNLIFIPIKVNGVELNFLLDSGVEETIMFSMEDKQEVKFFNVEKITLRGLGGEASVEGLKSTNNTLTVKGLKSMNHLLFVVLDQNFNLSSHVGISVNGIIGHSFLKSNLIEINYRNKRVTVYRDTDKNREKIEKKYEKIPISIEKSKPYLASNVIIDSKEIPTKLLIDIGNSDAIWLFENKSKNINIPTKNFKDYLGQGFSGAVEGKRAQIEKFSFSKFEFNNPVIAFPDSISIQNVKMVRDRAGSVGSEILKRFNLVFDYSNNNLFLKKNSNFDSPFGYNKSGIELQHYGLQWVQETVRLETVSVSSSPSDMNNSSNDFKYKFVLKPIYLIISIRENSSAARSGLQKGDVLVKINSRPAFEYSLEKIHLLLKSEEEKWITFEVERNSQLLTFKFQLLNEL